MVGPSGVTEPQPSANIKLLPTALKNLCALKQIANFLIEYLDHGSTLDQRLGILGSKSLKMVRKAENKGLKPINPS